MSKHKLPPLYSCVAPDGRQFWTTSLATVWWWENSLPAEERKTWPAPEDKPYKELIRLLKKRGYKCEKIKS